MGYAQGCKKNLINNNFLTPEKYLKSVGSKLKTSKKLGKKYYNYTGGPLDITGEIAEHETIRLLSLEVAPVRRSGFDACRVKIMKKEKILIKGRALQGNSNQGQRIVSINFKKNWDYIFTTILNSDLTPIEIYEAKRQIVENALTKLGSNARNERGQLSVRKF